MSFKITRDGKEIELTPIELVEAYSEYERNLMLEDVESLLEDEEEGFPCLPSEFLPAIAERALRNVSKNNSYYESYWCSVRDSIKSEIDVLVGQEYDRLVSLTFTSGDTISFSYKNIDGEECSFKGTIEELYNDWVGDCDMCPSNDTKIYCVQIGETNLAVLNFDELMEFVKAKLYSDSENSIDDDPSIGVNIMLDDEPATITLHLYTQKDFMGVERYGIALAISEAEGSYMLTVSFGEFIGLKNTAYVDVNNCGTKLIDALVEDGFATKTKLTKKSGFCEYPLYIFNEDFLKVAGSAEYEQYEKSLKSFKKAIGEEA